MTEEQFQTLLDTLSEQNTLLKRVVELLESTEQAAPNYQVDLANFPQFNWADIGATVEKSDPDGAAVVTWRGHQYLRRSAQNRFKPAIWFSRAIGKDENGENQYERLITFKELAAAEPLPEKVSGRLG